MKTCSAAPKALIGFQAFVFVMAIYSSTSMLVDAMGLGSKQERLSGW
jgi:hypothetical protein